MLFMEIFDALRQPSPTRAKISHTLRERQRKLSRSGKKVYRIRVGGRVDGMIDQSGGRIWSLIARIRASSFNHRDLRVFRDRRRPDEAVQLVHEDVGRIGILGVVLQHGGHRVVLAVDGEVVVARSRGRRGRGLVPVGVEPEVIAIGKVDVRDVVHLMNGHCKHTLVLSQWGA